MCGFSGEIDLDLGEADAATVVRMTATMADRGPDGVGLWAQGPVAVGHRRLKVIDLSERAQQPMVDAGLGLVVAFNGCIYNHAELRRQLEGDGYHFFSTGDTEVVLKAYHRWGDDFVDHLLGMFALCIVERDSGRMVLARDRLGVKPLYLAEVGRRLRFASTLPALVAGGGVDTSVDPVALHQYLMFHSVVPPPRTILRGVRKLAPATVLVVEPDGRRHERTYWQARFTRRPEHRAWGPRDWEDAVLEALRIAVERRMVADVPVGCLLSGGLDSSLVVGLLAEAGVRDLLTFSIGFESHGGLEGDEFWYSDLVARRFATRHHRIRIGGERLLPALEGAVAAMSEPMVSHDVVAFYLLSQEVARHVKVVQSGQGADEVFAGYHWYPPMVDAEGAVDGGVGAYSRSFFDRPAGAVAEVVGAAHRCPGDPAGAFVASHFSRPGASTPVDRALRIDSEVMLVDDPVKRVDNMTMAWGLEARVPFLDHELVELAAACPPELKLGQGGKGVLKEAARRVIPGEVIDRPKGYFPVPALTHLEGPLLDLVRDALTDPAAKQRGLFEQGYVDRLLARPNDELTPLRGNKLWQLGLLEMWLQSHGIPA
ncbi:MAG TPA: N-acetylglutaminylglutamine amidotransferase [Acidimicrobiales bacterium]|nr:N-acetylglutaminylglutamine amidotransferase [Acidimicrobiales bacterium]